MRSVALLVGQSGKIKTLKNSMTIKKLVENFLASEPKFRERSNKDRGIIHLLLKRSDSAPLWEAPRDLLTKFVQDYASMDRAWRQALEKNPDLRGSDYEDKAELETKKRISLGYPS